MLFGYTGNILHVDLSKGKISTEQPSEEFYKTYVGGSAMGTYYLFKNTPASIRLNAVVIEIDDDSGKAIGIERLAIQCA